MHTAATNIVFMSLNIITITLNIIITVTLDNNITITLNKIITITLNVIVAFMTMIIVIIWTNMQLTSPSAETRNWRSNFLD